MNKILPITGIALVILFAVFAVNKGATLKSDTHSHHDSHNHTSETHKARATSSKQEKQNAHQHSDKTPDDEDSVDHQEGIHLTQQQALLANIRVETLNAKKHQYQVYAPGEVKANGYQSYLVSPRTDSVIIARHASLGDHVVQGQKLVSLFSETIAQAQADFAIAESNWLRAKQLDSNTLSERELVEAESVYKASFGKLIAYGLTANSIKKIRSEKSETLGQYTLIAERDGVVLQDKFLQGQRVEAGEAIMLLANETDLWVEAYISPNKELSLSKGSTAVIELNGELYDARVIQESHTIDPTTRTRIVRLTVNNSDHRLHPGMFVNVNFLFSTREKVTALPEQALIRNPHGDWTVFVESSENVFEEKIVTRGGSLGPLQQIFGVETGIRVVTQGAFFIASESRKSGFDPHNH